MNLPSLLADSAQLIVLTALFTPLVHIARRYLRRRP